MFKLSVRPLGATPRKRRPHGRGLAAPADDNKNFKVIIKDCTNGAVAVQKSSVPPRDRAAATATTASLLDNLTMNAPEPSINNAVVDVVAEMEAANHRLADELAKYKTHTESMTNTTSNATDLAACGLPPLFGRKTIRKLQKDVFHKEVAVDHLLHQLDSLKEELAQRDQDLVHAKKHVTILQTTLDDVKTQAQNDQIRYETELATMRGSSTDEQYKKDLAEISATSQVAISTLQAQVQTEQARRAELEKMVALDKEKIDQLESSNKEKDALLDKAGMEVAALEQVVKAKDIELKKYTTPSSSSSIFESMKALVSPINATAAATSTSSAVPEDMFSPDAPIPLLSKVPFSKTKTDTQEEQVEEGTTVPNVAVQTANFPVDTIVKSHAKSDNNKAPLTPVPASRTKKSMLSPPRSIFKSTGRPMFSPRAPKIPLAEVSKKSITETKNDGTITAENMTTVTFAVNTYDSPIISLSSDENAPPPMTPKKTPFSMFKKPSGNDNSLRRSARKSVPTDRFTSEQQHL